MIEHERVKRSRRRPTVMTIIAGWELNSPRIHSACWGSFLTRVEEGWWREGELEWCSVGILGENEILGSEYTSARGLLARQLRGIKPRGELTTFSLSHRVCARKARPIINYRLNGSGKVHKQVRKLARWALRGRREKKKRELMRLCTSRTRAATRRHRRWRAS